MSKHVSMLQRTLALTAMAIAAATLVAACGGSGNAGSSGNDDNISLTLSGTAAAGAALVGTVQVTDANGKQKRVDTGSDGSYSIDVSGLTAPFVLMAEATVNGRTVQYRAPAVAADIGTNLINITPLSDLILANVAKDVAANCAASTACVAALSKEKIDAASGELAAKLKAAMKDVGLDTATDLLHGAFTAGSSKGIDALLDIIDVSVDPQTKVATIKNLLANTKVEDKLAEADTSTVLPETPSTVANTDVALVAAAKARMQELRDLLATDSSNDENARIIKLKDFCTSDFIWDGYSCLGYMILLNVGGRPNTKLPVIDQIAAFDVAGVDGIDPTVKMTDQTIGVLMKGDSYFSMLMRKAPDGRLYLAGNQRIAKFMVRASHAYIPDFADFKSHLAFDFKSLKDASGNAIAADSAEVRGPGLLNSVTFQSSGRIKVGEDGYNRAGVVEGVTSGEPYIATLKLKGATVATYKNRLLGAPIAQSELTPAMFPKIVNFPTNADNCAYGGVFIPEFDLGNLTASDFTVICNSDLNVRGEHVLDYSYLGIFLLTDSITFYAYLPNRWMLYIGQSMMIGATDNQGRRFEWWDNARTQRKQTPW